MSARRATPAVTLQRNPVRWQRVPFALKLRVEDGVGRIARVRADLAASVQVTSLPPVEVYDVIWNDPDGSGIIEGRTGPMPFGGSIRFGVYVPVHVALSDDEAAIRRVLLHEFGHCFFLDAWVTVQAFQCATVGASGWTRGRGGDRDSTEGVRSVSKGRGLGEWRPAHAVGGKWAGRRTSRRFLASRVQGLVGSEMGTLQAVARGGTTCAS